MSETITPTLLEQSGLGSFFRPRDLANLGVSFYELQKLVASGKVERVSRGLYRLTSAEITQVHTLAAVAATVPHGIVCLLSALSYYGIGTQLPRQIWLAIDAKAHSPRIPDFPVKLVRFSGSSLKHGVESVRFEGVSSFITSPARTVVDCFRFRRLIGSAVAIEALRESLLEGQTTRDDIWRSAIACRAASLVKPVLEVMSA